MLSLQDEDQEHLYDPKGDQNRVGSKVYYLGVECKDICIVLQVILWLDNLKSLVCPTSLLHLCWSLMMSFYTNLNI